MHRYAKRLFFALVLSTTCFVGTNYWYESQVSVVKSYVEKKPIATLSDHSSEVQRKPTTRVIWEELTKNDSLFLGESIRTNEDSEAKIVFLKTGTILEMEPDSQVVLEETEDGITLDFLKGNLFVKSVAGTKSQLTLKSGGNKIDLNTADLSLSKSKKGKLNIQVYSGNARLLQNGKSIKVVKGDSGVVTPKGMKKSKSTIEVLSPSMSDLIYLNPEKRKPVTFKWKKLPVGYTVYFEGGKKRSKLMRFKSHRAAGETGELKVPVRIGRLYWRLVAEPINLEMSERVSPVVPLKVLALNSPTQIFPTNKRELIVKGNKKKIELKWLLPMNFKNTIVEVATDRHLKNKIFEKIFYEKTESTVLNIDKVGSYYWRVTGFVEINGKSKALSSKITSFGINSGVKLVPPALVTPVNAYRMKLSDLSAKGMDFFWDSVPGINEYLIQIRQIQNGKSTELLSKRVSETTMSLKDLKPGVYEWAVSSTLDESQSLSAKTSKRSEARRFAIYDIPKIKWVGGDAPSESLYATEKPYLKVRWSELPKSINVASWRARLKLSDAQPEVASEWISVSKAFLQKWVDKPGKYDVEVEALDKTGEVVAKSNIKEVTVKEKPLLPAPSFSSQSDLETTERGNITIKWNSVAGASNYQVFIKDENGKVLKQSTVNKNVAALKNLKPGNYKVSVIGVDQHKRVGVESKNRGLSVPAVSNIRAPKLKSFKVN